MNLFRKTRAKMKRTAHEDIGQEDSKVIPIVQVVHIEVQANAMQCHIELLKDSSNDCKRSSWVEAPILKTNSVGLQIP